MTRDSKVIELATKILHAETLEQARGHASSIVRYCVMPEREYVLRQALQEPEFRRTAKQMIRVYEEA